MKIKKNIVCMLAYIYMTIPIIIFLITWLKAYIGFPMAVILLFGLFTIYKNEYKGQDTYFKFPIKHLVIILILLFVWIVLSGAGKLFYETWDWHWRNAIFRDLINYKWPVIYEESQTALVYYIMQWIVPAIVGKIGGWSIGNFALMIWNLIGVVLVYFLLIHICKKKDVPIFYAISKIFFVFGCLNKVC